MSGSNLKLSDRTEMKARAEGHEPAPICLCDRVPRTITTPSGYYGDGHLALFDTSANTAFAVLAWNSYDAMREALEQARGAIASVGREQFGIGGEGETHWYLADELISRIDAAIRLARGLKPEGGE